MLVVMKTNFAAKMFARDLDYMIALSDQRKRELAEQRKQCQENKALCAHLEAEARRRGQPGIDWPEYFRNSYLV